jgi:mannosyltransferase OCH1-like enzyme
MLKKIKVNNKFIYINTSINNNIIVTPPKNKVLIIENKQEPINNYIYSNNTYNTELNNDMSITIDRLKPDISINETDKIPLNIFQTWHTLKIPFFMNKYTTLLKKNNPEFTYYLYDDNMCKTFIEMYFDQDTLDAYNTLIPGAYKADLWRYCILYVYGGIYLDIKYIHVNDFKLINITDDEYFVRDRQNGIYQALLVCLPKNKILLKSINQIIYNVKNKLYLNNPLEVTGPQLISKFINNIDKLEMAINPPYIMYNSNPILETYKEYTNEQIKHQLLPHYSILWKSKKIYK